MAYSYTVYTGNGSTTQFTVPFPYIRKEHVFVTVNDVTTTYTWVNATTVSVSPAPANGAEVIVKRLTPVSSRLVDYTDGSTLVAADLDTDSLQHLYTEQELTDSIGPAANLRALYYGAYTTDPTVDPYGQGLDQGDLYFNTQTKVMRVWNGTAWQNASNTVSFVRWRKTAAGGETSLSNVDDLSQTLTYTVGYEQVYINGVLLTRGVDYTASNGVAITGLAALTAGDIAEVLGLSVYAVNNQSGQIDFLQSGTGAVSRTVESKLKDEISIKDFGAVGDGSNNDHTAVDNAISATSLTYGKASVRVNDGYRFKVDSLTNFYGVDLRGDGHIVKAVTGGLQKINSYADKHKYVFGLEYMAAFHNLLITQNTTPTRKPIMVFSGDSTTEGVGVDTDYQIHALIKKAGEELGLQSPYGLSSINRGLSGASTETWYTSRVAGDLAQNPDLLVLRWGINDPTYLAAGGQPTADAGQDYPGRRTVADFLTSLRNGLAQIRASRSIASLSIVLMSPNSTSDTPNARDELWYEQIVPGIKQAARQYGCTFIDTYGFLRDSRPAAGIWMDDPMGAYPAGAGRAIHPLNVMNTWIAGLMASVIFPEGLRYKIGRANMRSITGVEFAGNATYTPDVYPHGITLGRGDSVSSFPFDGGTTTIRTGDNIVIQLNYPYLSSAPVRRLAYRMGRASNLGAGAALGWEAWQMLGETSSAVTPGTGFSLPGSGGMRTLINGTVVVAEGYITMNTPATVASGTTVATVATDFRPSREAFYGLVTIWNGSTFEMVRVLVGNANGAIVLNQATTINANRIYLCASWTTSA